MNLPRVTVDTNVFVSGLMNPDGPNGEVVAALLAGELVPLFDARTLAEAQGVLARPRFGFPAEKVARLLRQIVAFGERVVAEPLTFELPDVKDVPFLEVALSGQADALVTGNARDFEGAPTGLVVSAREFLAQRRGGH